MPECHDPFVASTDGHSVHGFGPLATKTSAIRDPHAAALTDTRHTAAKHAEHNGERMRYLEDFKAGESIDLGSVTVTEDEILEFARRYDPQPFHVDPQAARTSSFGGLIASGWHTCSLWMRGFADVVLNNAHSLGSPGGDELRWLKPVRPGDTLTATYQVLEVTPSERSPSRGTVRARGQMTNQHGDVVMTVIVRNLFTRRRD